MMIYEIMVGRLLCRHVRDYLKERQFVGDRIEWMESSGWLERNFTIKDDDAAVKRIERHFQLWSAQINGGKQGMG